MKQRVLLHIDRLVLIGFRNEDRNAIAMGIREAFSRQLATPEVLNKLVGRSGQPRLRIDPARICFGASPIAVGEVLAECVTRGITR